MTRRGRAALLLGVSLLTAAPGLSRWNSVAAQPSAQQAAARSNPGTSADLSTSQRLEQLQRDLQQQRQLSAAKARELQALRASIQNLSAQQRQTLSRLDTLAASASKLENEIATVTARVALAERALADTAAQLNVTQARVERLQGDVREILQLQYRDRSGRYLQLLSQSRSLSDLLIRLRYANIAGEYNTRVIQTLAGEIEVLDRQKAQQARQTQDLKELQAQRTAVLKNLTARRAEQTTLLSQLRSSEAGKRTLATQRQAEQALAAQTIDQLVGQVVAERSRLEAERQRRLEEERRRRAEEARRIAEAQERARQEALRLARIRAEQERVARQRAADAQAARQRAADAQAAAQAARQRAAQQAAQTQREAQVQREQAALQQRSQQVQQAQVQVEQQLAPLPTLSGPLGFPLPGGRVQTPYGAGGSPWVVLSGGPQAVAAQEGNVLAVTYYASLGWVVLVDHGSSVTAYFGLREPLVSVGNRVGRGTPVGTVGGSSIIGPDSMAFQLRRGGVPVPPGF
ncbi:peptidoglycan DD-metalloendopeptidase family protein [Deinococcus aquaticus]|uniref:Peptidoglycan DD-metalloendopeptidase family protein n=1 Tax=Deinococcus aquaticus TaxID=328692 RepID=A0ABY7UZR3_9DEIO|nr:M23 family metallopeptidase [Deinococcus aquaticus]WDA58378.1 peptidoglycan DD-metalloendopeptidase family protein [Deinococcus aquaticus]